MYLLDELDFYRDNAGKYGIKAIESEYEVLAKVHLTGTLDLECVFLKFWEVPIYNDFKNNVKSIYLKTLSYRPNRKKNQNEITSGNKSYNLPGGIASEVVILLTLFTRAHFVLSRRLKIERSLIMYKFPYKNVVRTQIDDKEINLNTIKPLFDMLEGLRLREQTADRDGDKCSRLEPFMLAARLYYMSLSILEQDESLAYLILISSLEPLLYDYHQGTDKKERFVRFIVSYLKGNKHFLNDPTRPKEKDLRFKDAGVIAKYLANIYEARAGHFDSGRSFPLFYEAANSEIPLSDTIPANRQRNAPGSLLPSFFSFERMVHHVLIAYLKKESRIGFDTVK